MSDQFREGVAALDEVMKKIVTENERLRAENASLRKRVEELDGAWTNVPPKVHGWYWTRTNRSRSQRMVLVTARGGIATYIGGYNVRTAAVAGGNDGRE